MERIARGEVAVNEEILRQGDGAAVSDESGLDLHGISDAEVLVFNFALQESS